MRNKSIDKFVPEQQFSSSRGTPPNIHVLRAPVRSNYSTSEKHKSHEYIPGLMEAYRTRKQKFIFRPPRKTIRQHENEKPEMEESKLTTPSRDEVRAWLDKQSAETDKKILEVVSEMRIENQSILNEIRILSAKVETSNQRTEGLKPFIVIASLTTVAIVVAILVGLYTVFGIGLQAGSL